MRRFKRRIIFCLIVSLTMLTLLSGQIGFAAEKKQILQREMYTRPNMFGVDINEVSGGSSEDALQLWMMCYYKYLHPEVKWEVISWNPWVQEAPAQLRAMLAAGTEPSAYPTDDPQKMIAQGFFADITEIVETWKAENSEYVKGVPEAIWQECMKNGRYYAVPGSTIRSYGGFAYRKDLFKEAEIEMPANWTIDQFRDIAKRLTNPAKRQWGLGIVGDLWAYREFTYWAGVFGIPVLIPDTTGNYTWRLNPDLVKIAQFYHDLVWVDKSALTSIELGVYDLLRKWGSGEIAINSFGNPPQLAVRARIYREQMGGVDYFREKVGFTTHPLAAQDLRWYEVHAGGYHGCSPNLSKDELKAAFDVPVSLYIQQGLEFTMRWIVDFKEWVGFDTLGIMYNVNRPIGYDALINEQTPPGWREVWKELCYGVPTPPSKLSYGFSARVWVDKYQDALTSLVQTIITNAKADPKTETEKVIREINGRILNFKNPEMDIKEYWNALGEYYRANFPEYYQVNKAVYEVF